MSQQKPMKLFASSVIMTILAVAWWQYSARFGGLIEDPRTEVVFWHFWGGPDREVVEDVVRRFNASQDRLRVRAIAMPGNNLQAKSFLSVAGGDPPDLLNQDNPILADWSAQGVIQSIESIATEDDIARLKHWFFDSASRLSQVDNQYFAVCNGLDIRALYYNRTLLEQHGLQPPVTIRDLDNVCNTISPASHPSRDFFAFIPDSRRLWAWGVVFGGDFFAEQRVSLTQTPIVKALTWMASFSNRYGADNIASFRQGDQSLPGKTFPLLPVNDHQMVGRYGMIMDGQWRVRDVAAFTTRRRQMHLPVPEFGVCPLPFPDYGRANAGWVNGNFFVIPTGAKNATGAWEFIRFWIGLNDPQPAAQTAAKGGWIPVSQTVVDHPDFQQFLSEHPLFQTFVELAASPDQYPIPPVCGAPYFKRTVEAAAYQAMVHPQQSADGILADAQQRIQDHLDRQIRYRRGFRE